MKKTTSKIYVEQEKENPQRKKSQSKKVKTTAQDTIPFDEIYDNGIFRIGDTYSLIFYIPNIDYKVFKDNERNGIYKRYQKLLNCLPSEVKYQEFIVNTDIDINNYVDALVPQYNGVCTQEIYDSFVEKQKAIIAEAENSSCEQQIYGALSFKPVVKMDSINVLFKHYNEIAAQFAEINIKTELLPPEKSFEIIHRIYHFSNPEQFLLPTSFFNVDVNLKDYLVPSSFKFASKYNEVGLDYSCVMFAKRFSRTCDDEFVMDLLDNSSKIIVSKHFSRLEKDTSLDILKEQMNDLQGRIDRRLEINYKRSGASGGSSFIPWSLQRRKKELEALEEKLSSTDCDLFEFAMYIYVAANSLKELNDLRDYIKQTARRHQVTLDVLTGATIQEKGLQCILPFAQPALSDDKTLLGQPFYFTTDEVANLIPFTYQNNIIQSGICYGINQITHMPIIIDRSEGLNANGFVVGTSGAGKSMAGKLEFLNGALKYPDDVFIFLDPEREYMAAMTKNNAFDAQVITVSPNTNTHINLFDTDITYTDEGQSAVALKTDFIMTFCECVKGSGLTANEKTVLDRCVNLVYQDFLANDGDKKYLPTLVDFYNILLAQPEKEAKDMALKLELYVKGNFSTFAHHTNVDLNKRIIIYDVQEMGKQLSDIGSLVILESIWQKVIENRKRGIRTWFTTDEFSMFFRDTNGVFRTGDFFENVYKRIRKYGGVASGYTQNMSEVMESPQATKMLQNSNFCIMLAQNETDLDKIKSMFKLSEKQAAYLDIDEPGKGLIKNGKQIIPFDNQINKNSAVYKLFSTKMADQKKE